MSQAGTKMWIKFLLFIACFATHERNNSTSVKKYQKGLKFIIILHPYVHFICWVIFCPVVMIITYICKMRTFYKSIKLYSTGLYNIMF